MDVLVFSTTVETNEQISLLRPALNSRVGNGRWNFALDDRDRILRVISNSIDASQAIAILKEKGFECRELED